MLAPFASNAVSSAPRVLVLGAQGFLGRHFVATLREAGCTVIEGVRRATQTRQIAVDFTRDREPEVWRARLQGIDVVVNAVGILREQAATPFAAVHQEAPIALLRACERVGVQRFIQISALGICEDASEEPLAYFASKAAADRALLASTLAVTVVRPSLVFGLDGASSRSFLAAASLPVQLLPGEGEQPVQPLHVDDLCALVLRLVTMTDTPPRLIHAVGPRPLGFAQMLAVYRANLGLPAPVQFGLPMAWVRLVVRLAEYLPQRVVARETLAMLERGNTADPQPLIAMLGRAPRPPEAFIAAAEREGARHCANALWLQPLARLALAVLWLVSGLLGLFFADAMVAGWLARLGLDPGAATVVRVSASIFDLALAALSLAWPRRTLWLAQLWLIAVYTPLATIAAPEAWLHPFGPLLKNLPIVVLLLWLWANTPARKS
ncbi:hypothetical protein BURK2_02439 [Burkholderiales bacterium]|nr:hypothetical protein BURK2_02439 [Burkholderiales bacterium]